MASAIHFLLSQSLRLSWCLFKLTLNWANWKDLLVSFIHRSVQAIKRDSYACHLWFRMHLGYWVSRQVKFFQLLISRQMETEMWYSFTWFPKTPIAVAFETSFGPNQTAAKSGGIPSTKIWETATTVWPTKVTQNKFGLAENIFIQEPRAVPQEPIRTAIRNPWKRQKKIKQIVWKLYSKAYRWRDASSMHVHTQIAFQ